MTADPDSRPARGDCDSSAGGRFVLRHVYRKSRRILATALPACLAVCMTACTEGQVLLSLRGEWQLHSGTDSIQAVDQQFSERVNLPADLTGAAGLTNQAGRVVLRRQLPPEIDELLRRGAPVAFNLGMASDVFQVYLNEVRAGGRGRVEPYEPGYFRTLVVDLPGDALRAAGEPNYIQIEIYTRGVYPVAVLGPAFEIGAAQAVYASYFRGEITVFVLLTIYAILGGYHLLLAFRRPGELYNLYFGLFAILLAGYWFFDTELRGIVFGDAVIAGMLTEHLILYNLGPQFLLFLSHLFYRRHSLLALGVGATMLVLSLVAIFGSFPVQRLALKVWQAGVIPLMLYIVYYVFRAWRQGRPDAGFLVVGVLFFMAAGLHDILLNAGVFERLAEAISWVPLYRPPLPIASKAFLLVVLGVAGTLANRFARVHTEAERLNVELEDRVHARTRELREAQRETDDILDTVQEGLLLLYRASGGGFTTGMQYSRRLESILRSDDIGGRDFARMIEPMLLDPAERLDAGEGREDDGEIDRRPSEEILEAARKYLDLMFAGKLSEKMLARLNPLRDIRLRLPDGEHRDLQFTFYRPRGDVAANAVDAGDSDTTPAESESTRKDPQLMAVVIDVTEQKELTRRLLAERQKSEAERARLYAVLRTDPGELAGFIRDCEGELARAREAFAGANRDALFRAVHAMKGDAGMLDLEFFADCAHRTENSIEGWRPAETKNEPAPAEIAEGLDALQTNLDAIRDDLERMREFREGLAEKSGEHESDPRVLVRALERLGDRVSARVSKRIDLQTNEFMDNSHIWGSLSPAARGVLRDALIQLLRNSVVHGIEDAAARTAAGKDAAGVVQIALTEDANAAGGSAVVLSIRDDGRGLDLEKLREKARSLNRWPAEEIAGWADKDVAALIFAPGLSTATRADGDAGRGVGMDLVRERVRTLGGRIETRFAPGRYCEFRLRVPAEAV